MKPVRLETLYARLDSSVATSSRGRGLPTDAQNERPLAGRRVLLAEDNDVNALLVEKHLRRLGAKVERARDGVETVALVCEAIGNGAQGYDAVLMDVRMPRLDGLGAARMVRAAEAKAGAKPMRMIALTANAFDEDKEAALAAGLDIFLTKPVDLVALAAAIAPKDDCLSIS